MTAAPRAVPQQESASASTRTQAHTHPALAAGSATRAVRFAPAAWTDPSALRDAVTALEASGVTLIVLGDDFASGSDALTTAAWLGPATSTALLVPELPVTHNEPFHAATGTATLDYVARARGGWSPVVQTTEEEARLVGRRSAAPAAQAWREAVEIDDVVTRLWTSWEPDAEIRDEATARFLDREKVHYVDFSGTDSVGEEFTVKGPSIVPRPPQGELPTVVTVDSPESADAAARVADVVILTDTAAEAGLTPDTLRTRAAHAGRSVVVLSEVPQLSTPEDAHAFVTQVQEEQAQTVRVEDEGAPDARSAGSPAAVSQAAGSPAAATQAAGSPAAVSQAEGSGDS